MTRMPRVTPLPRGLPWAIVRDEAGNLVLCISEWLSCQQRKEALRAYEKACGQGRSTLPGPAAVWGTAAIVALVGALAAMRGQPAWASGGVPDPAPNAKVRIGANECWTGPLAPGQEAAHAIVSSSNRYSPQDQRGDFIKAVMGVEGVPYDHVAPWPGSSDPLSRAVVTFTSPTRGLVTADPTFELAGRTAEWLGSPLTGMT